jgi:AraC-like DNA-binding protein
MIIENIKFNLFQKKIFEKMIIVPPLKLYDTFQNEACFLYMVSGKQEINAKDEHWRLNAKEAVLMNCGLHFSEWLKSSNSEKCEAIAIHLYPDILKKIYEKEFPLFILNAKARNEETTKTKIVNDEFIFNYIKSMQFYFNNPSIVSDELLILKLKELIILLLQTENISSIQSLFVRLFAPRDYNFKEIINKHLLSNLTIDELAQLTNLSVSSFKREFKRLYNDSPAKLFKDHKLNHASNLLRLTDKRIGDIAYECGFNDQSHFTKSFLSKFGVTPSVFRLNQKSQSLN